MTTHAHTPARGAVGTERSTACPTSWRRTREYAARPAQRLRAACIGSRVHERALTRGEGGGAGGGGGGACARGSQMGARARGTRADRRRQNGRQRACARGLRIAPHHAMSFVARSSSSSMAATRGQEQGRVLLPWSTNVSCPCGERSVRWMRTAHTNRTGRCRTRYLRASTSGRHPCAGSAQPAQVVDCAAAQGTRQASGRTPSAQRMLTNARGKPWATARHSHPRWTHRAAHVRSRRGR